MNYFSMRFFLFTQLIILPAVSFICQADSTTQSDIVQSQSISSVEKEADRLDLTKSEYIRYTEIMQGPLGRWNKDIDPLIALGIFAETESERIRYAELYALQEHDLTSRTLAFGRVYRSAFNRLFPNASVVDKNLLEPYYRSQQYKKGENDIWGGSYLGLNDGDRLIYFPHQKCQKCGKVVKSLYDHVSKFTNVAIDIYVVESKSGNEVRSWAKINDINVDWVINGIVTLNMDNGVLDSLKNRSEDNETNLYLNRKGMIYSINKEEFGL